MNQLRKLLSLLRVLSKKPKRRKLPRRKSPLQLELNHDVYGILRIKLSISNS
jgi:hypothetical protein